MFHLAETFGEILILNQLAEKLLKLSKNSFSIFPLLFHKQSKNEINILQYLHEE